MTSWPPPGAALYRVPMAPSKRGTPREKRGKRGHAGRSAEAMLADALALFAHSARPEEHVLARFERQYPYAPPSRRRADFAWPEARLLVELQGGIWAKGDNHGHASPQGIIGDNGRLNAATLNGWRVLRFLTDAAEDRHVAETIDVIARALAWRPPDVAAPRLMD